MPTLRWKNAKDGAPGFGLVEVPGSSNLKFEIWAAKTPAANVILIVEGRMLGNFAFTLYELMGYLLPGAVMLVGLSVLEWSIFCPLIPLEINGNHFNIFLIVFIVLSCYILGHATQGIGNFFWSGAESALLDSEIGNAPLWMKKRAGEFAGELLKSNHNKIEPRWVFRSLDEFVCQKGEMSDRDMFVYREGFYRGTSIALFFLATSLMIRMLVPGCSIHLDQNIFLVSRYEVLINACVVCLIAFLFAKRYKRFAEYRVSRAVLASLIISNGSVDNNPELGRESDATKEK